MPNNQPEFSPQDQQYMQRAIQLAKRGHYTTSPNPRVGCVIVKDGKIIGEGYHQKAGEGHAEVNALNQALQAGKSTQGATAYVTLEPCSHYGRTPPCAESLIKAGVKHVVAAMVDPNPQVAGNGLAMLEKAGITTQTGLFEKEAQTLNVGFIHAMLNKRPYVRCKMAASLDGKTAMANGESQWITSKESRQDVQRLRAQSCAIITGADSLIFDNAKMTVRWSELGVVQECIKEPELRQPVRVVIDSQNRLSPEITFFKETSPIIIMCAEPDRTKIWPDHVTHISVPLKRQSKSSKTYKLDLEAVLTALTKLGFNDVLLESGANLVGAFVEADLVNELILYQAPKLMGNDAKGLVNMPSLVSLSQAKNLVFKEMTSVGCDICITAHFSETH